MKYVRSITTGAVLPYNNVLARLPNVQVMTPAECDAHDLAVKPKAAKPKPAKKKVEKKVAKETSFVVSSNEDEIDAVVAALAID
jgi:hypothetical protein